jgi:hypothetical protein
MASFMQKKISKQIETGSVSKNKLYLRKAAGFLLQLIHNLAIRRSKSCSRQAEHEHRQNK